MPRFFASFSMLVIAGLICIAASLPVGLKVGDTAPDFRLKNVDGNMVSLKDFKKAKGFIVTFTCNTCPYAVLYEDRIIALHKKMEPKGFPVIAIQPNDPDIQSGDSFSKMQERAREKNFPFPYLLDEGQKVYPQYGATRTPHFFILDKNLKVQYIGALDDNPQDASAVTKRYVEDAVAAIEKGKTPEVTSTKAIGCGIKAKK
ncbi:MAG: hypothetical protein RIR17_947 [Planctomycetota bacterium]|jgi:peroxiredoxin